MELSAARILITGGAGSLGSFLSTELLRKAALVIITDNNSSLLEKIPAQQNLIKLYCDLTDPDAVEVLITRVFEEYGGVNVCINNAGIIHSEPLVNIAAKGGKKHSLANWKKVLDVNLNAVFYVTANVVEKLMIKRQKGVVINISSIAAKGNVGQSAYAASKAAVEALTQTWSKEFGMFKIRCACIAPGFFDTLSTRDSLSETTLSKIQKNVPLMRLGEVGELLSAIEFIITNEYYNGKTLSLDGGLSI
jgi:3-oxoacyl-[acyl-carrier protein] reductase